MERIIYEPDLGLEGTIKELVDWANKYTNDYSDQALERISELAASEKMEEKYIKIPLLLKDERKREYENEDGIGVPYERMKIDHYLFDKISYSSSDSKGGEEEIWSENDKVIISIMGIDKDGHWSAVGSCDIKEFMAGEYNWLDNYIGQIYYCNKQYDE